MARLEYINHEFYEGSLRDDQLIWQQQARTALPALPQVFWEDGSAWNEVNVWALDRAASGEVSMQTVKRTMKHLCSYAYFLEERGLDWQHFPIRREEQALRKFRKYLMDALSSGELSNATASNCINAVVRFYRFAQVHRLVGTQSPLWEERPVVLRYFDASGFARSVERLGTDLGILNRRRIGFQLEDGLLPLSSKHMTQLLSYTSNHVLEEIHLMLVAGFFTGARVGTVTTLTISALHSAREDPLTPGIHLLRVGPGTEIATKFSITGEIMVPSAVLEDLKVYSSSARRLLREAKAAVVDKDRLFLGRRGQPYSADTVDRLVGLMRSQAVAAGLSFMHRFRFHQSRATFGTWLMEILLDAGARTDAIRIVRDAMLHKDERTTFGYITFIERQRSKGQLAAAFNEAFTGFKNRDWNIAPT